MNEVIINLDKISKIEIRRRKEVKYRVNSSVFSLIPFISWFTFNIFAEGKEFSDYDSFCLWLRDKKDFTEFPDKDEIYSYSEKVIFCRPSLTFISETGRNLGRKYFSDDKELIRALKKIEQNNVVNFIHFTEESKDL